MAEGHQSTEEDLKYHHGFGNTFESEAYPNALPQGRNNPRIHSVGLHTEQLSGTAFTAPRSDNRRTWLYRIKPSVAGTSNMFVPCADSGNSELLPETFGRADWSKDMKLDPNPMRWGAPQVGPYGQMELLDNILDNLDPNGTVLIDLIRNGPVAAGVNFIQGINTFLGSGDPTSKSGIGIYLYACNANMSNRVDGQDMHMYNSDGDFLIVPQQLSLSIQTEMGKMTVCPGEICVIPRGVVFTVNILQLDDEKQITEENKNNFARGYILEIFRGHFNLPELGPIGSNGLANARDFQHPVACYESDETIVNKQCRIVNKFGQHLFVRTNPHSPYNVVAWHGNYLPYKYDLRKFCAVNSVTYDHPDPSIYTVLTAKGGDEDGTALADFVIFPPRVMATGE